MARTAIVAGALGYVGGAIARKLSKDGFKVAALYRNSSDEEVGVFLASLSGVGHKAYRCDLASAAEIQRALELASTELGPVFAAVYAAGSLPAPKPLNAVLEADLRAEFDRDVFTCFNFLSLCARELKKNKDGVLIGITTAGVATSVNTKARGAYSPIKFAQQGMLVALKEELAAANVRVFSIAPGVMAGGLNRSTPKAFLDMVREKVADKKLADAEDVAETASMLCSEKSRGVSRLTFLIAPESKAL